MTLQATLEAKQTTYITVHQAIAITITLYNQTRHSNTITKSHSRENNTQHSTPHHCAPTLEICHTSEETISNYTILTQKYTKLHSNTKNSIRHTTQLSIFKTDVN
ncbi:hypothetical protein E2C01_006008 [Portunus trituberculatus]|uniref:Uncharacterized protein n=1 Tax=Portunus trituberculatus TaxID=210409 RepID=A0A5B7CV20_PORTR|nr:hypothetical protein [Portunus trituberculatus]